MKFKHLLLLLILALIYTACSGTRLQKYPADSCTGLPGDKTVSVIKDKCGLCHAGDFATKELICARKSMITDSVSSKRMPTIGKLTEDQLNTILKWDL